MPENKEETKEVVAILTNFMEFNPGYSLTGIAQDQCKMLQDNGHPVKLFVNSQYAISDDDKHQFTHNTSCEKPPVDLYRTIPFSHLIDYTSIKDISDHHKVIANQTKEMLIKELQGVRHVFTHDFLFTGWFLPYGMGVLEAARELPDTMFYHWVHSTPTANKDWWNYNKWLGENNFIIFPNQTEVLRVAEQYQTTTENVECLHHIKDPRTWCDFDRDSNDFIDKHPGVLSADIVKVYPASSDRFSAKGLKAVIKIFERLKALGNTVCLVIANQWATGRQRKEDLKQYINFARNAGLIIDKEFIFTSEWNGGKYNTGIPKRMLRDLMACSNLFIFPTREESFGLVALEVPLSTAAVVITNRSLTMMEEIHGGFTESFHFGSFHHDFNCDNMGNYYIQLGNLIHGTMKRNSVVQHRTFLRQRYNWNYLYTNEYLPLFLSQK